MKAIIPVAGVGTKLRPHTHTMPKPLIPVAGKPILGHIIESFINAEVTEIIFIIGYLGEKIKDYVVANYQDRIEMTFVVQEPRKGLAHAIWVAKEAFDPEEEILIVLGDTIFGEETQRIKAIEGSVLAVHEVDTPRAFGIAVLDQDGFVKELAEKPEIPVSNLALSGMYKIRETAVLLEVLEDMLSEGTSEEAEYSLTDALMEMVRRGMKFRGLHVTDWFDCGRKSSLLLTNRILLERQENAVKSPHEGSVIIPPVYIAQGCTITNSIIGPYVAIADNATLRNTIVKNSILGAFSQLDSIILTGSVIGNDTSLKGKATSINIGDNTEIDFGK